MTEEPNPPPADDDVFEPPILVSIGREQAESALNRAIPIDRWQMLCDVLDELVVDRGEDFGLRRLIIAEMGSLLDAIERDEKPDPGKLPNIGEREPIPDDEVDDILRRLEARQRGKEA